VRYYIGYSTVFNPYGFTDQVAQVVYIVNEKYSIGKTIFGVKYKMIKVLPNRLYGLEIRKIKNEDIAFSKKERAMVDVFEFYDMKKAYDILTSQIDKIDIKVFIEYVAQYPVQKIRRRIGYFLEKLGADKKLLSRIDVGKTGYSSLYNTGSNKGRVDNKWRVIVNG
jgi:predicted transcriptional regulator of viral defense system